MRGSMQVGGVFWPVFLILVGTVILLVNVGVLPPQTWRFWPLVFILLGLFKLSGFVDQGEGKNK